VIFRVARYSRHHLSLLMGSYRGDFGVASRRFINTQFETPRMVSEGEGKKLGCLRSASPHQRTCVAPPARRHVRSSAHFGELTQRCKSHSRDPGRKLCLLQPTTAPRTVLREELCPCRPGYGFLGEGRRQHWRGRQNPYGDCGSRLMATTNCVLHAEFPNSRARLGWNAAVS